MVCPAKKVAASQGAIECFSCSTAHTLSGQGATEYLVLLSAVLIVALVSISLLGFFPGTASSAQEEESRVYWQSAAPIAIVEAAAKYEPNHVFPLTLPYLRVKNTGSHPLRITKIFGGDYSISMIWRDGDTGFTRTYGDYQNISEIGYVQPGEETYFGHRRDGPGAMVYPNVPYTYGLVFCSAPCSGSWAIPSVNCTCSGGTTGTWADALYNAQSMCNADGTGYAVFKEFGFEYEAYSEGQQVTKRQISKFPLVIRCSGTVPPP